MTKKNTSLKNYKITGLIGIKLIRENQNWGVTRFIKLKWQGKKRKFDALRRSTELKWQGKIRRFEVLWGSMELEWQGKIRKTVNNKISEHKIRQMKYLTLRLFKCKFQEIL